MGANEKHDAAYHGGPTPSQQSKADEARERLGIGPVGSRTDATPEPEAPKPAPLGPVGRWALGIVALAIVTPFVAILWAWAVGVVNTLLAR